jgi:hypothetical protein
MTSVLVSEKKVLPWQRCMIEVKLVLKRYIEALSLAYRCVIRMCVKLPKQVTDLSSRTDKKDNPTGKYVASETM